jgi:hypothetical protein
MLYGAGAPDHVFALIDATLRSEAAGIFDLDVIDRPATCLFSGAAFEQYAEAAPWLVDLSVADAEAEDLSEHKDFFERHWPTQTNVLIQTNTSMADLKRHLRRFVQLPVIEDNTRRFFRFWDGRLLPDFLRAVASDGPRARRMGLTDDDIELCYICQGPDGPIAFVPDAKALAPLPVSAMTLSFKDFDATARAEHAARCARMAQRIQSDFAVHLSGRSIEQITSTVRAAVDRFIGFGFREHAHLHFFAAWSVLYGVGFEQADTTGRLQDICRSNAPEKERFAAFRAWFDTFTMAA